MSVSLYGSGQTAIQIVSATNSTSTSTSSSSFVATNLAITITPQSTTSKILIMVIGGGFDTQASGRQIAPTFYRNNTTELTGNSLGFGTLYGGNSQIQGSFNCGFVDSPSTTSATTYTLYLKSNNGGTVIWNAATALTTILAIEISGS